MADSTITGLPLSNSPSPGDVVPVDVSSGGSITTSSVTLSTLVEASGQAGSKTLAGLTDVDVAGAVAGDVLTYNGTQYVTTAPSSGGSGGGSSTLGGDTDVDFTNATAGAVLGVNPISFGRRQRVVGSVNAGGTVTATLAEPASVNSLLVAYLATNCDAVSTPTGFSELLYQGASNSSPSNPSGVFVYFKFAAGGETALSIAITPGNAYAPGGAVLVVEEWTGATLGNASGTNFVSGAAGTANANQTTLTLDNVPAGSVVIAIQDTNTSGDQGAVAGWTEYYNPSATTSPNMGLDLWEQTESTEQNVSFTFTALEGNVGSEAHALIRIDSTGNKPFAFVPQSSGGSSTSPYDSVILAQSPAHYWPLNDAAGATAAADAVGSNPLTFNGTPTFGFPPLARDGETSAYCDDSNYFIIPGAALNGTSDYTATLLFMPGETSNNDNILGLGNGGDNSYIQTLNGYYRLIVNGAGPNLISSVAAGRAVHLAMKQLAGSGTSLYLNGMLIGQENAAEAQAVTQGLLGALVCRVAKLAYWDSAIPLSQILAQVAAAGL
jgi:hypothetical protein